MGINNRRKNYIKDLAEFLALEYEETATPLTKIAESEELAIYYDDYENAFDGTLMHDNGFHIHLNTNLGNSPGKEKGRFTLAHELGHYFIDSHRVALLDGIIKPHPSRYNKNKHQLIEREADYFASCLLMPESRFRTECEKYKHFSFQVIEELAQKFKISLTACAIRFADIGTHPIMIVYMENSQIEWQWKSQDFQYWNLADGKRIIPKDSLAGQYFKTGLGKKRTEELWAIDWFDGIRDEDLSLRIFEQIIPHYHRVLSVVWY